MSPDPGVSAQEIWWGFSECRGLLKETVLKSVHAGNFTPVFLQKSCNMKLLNCFRMNCFDEFSLLSQWTNVHIYQQACTHAQRHAQLFSSMWHHILCMSHIHRDWRISRSAQGAVISWRDIWHDSIVGRRRRGGRNLAQEKVQQDPFFSLFIHFL